MAEVFCIIFIKSVDVKIYLKDSSGKRQMPNKWPNEKGLIMFIIQFGTFISFMIALTPKKHLFVKNNLRFMAKHQF